MKKLARYLVGIAGVLILTAGSAAADRTMVVVIDATGSMLAARDDCLGASSNRFETAKCWAKQELLLRAGQTDGLTGGVQIFTFHNDFFTGEMGLIDHGTFLDPNLAADAIDDLTMPTGSTPLAGSMCSAIQAASDSGGPSTTVRFLGVYTDGGHNAATPDPFSCAGPNATGSGPPFTAGSWQDNVYNFALDASPAVTLSPSLFINDVTTFSLGPVRDEVFFNALAEATGGNFIAMTDDTSVPVFDFDGDGDVDRNDAIAVALNFGSSDLTFDINGDSEVGFRDYRILASLIGDPDPYAEADTITCGRRNERVVLNGKVIEDAGVTISVRGECTLVIRNSLIVSGQTAVRVRGGAELVVEDSIIVGEGAWLDSRGTTSVSASGSIFHGFQEVRGNFDYEDLGGNTFRRPGDGTESGGPDSLYADDGGLGVGCSAAGGASRSSLWLALFVAAMVIRRRRRR